MKTDTLKLSDLSRVQVEILRLIAQHQEEHHCGPTMREIVEAVHGISSTSVAYHHTTKLRRLGLIQWSWDKRGRMMARSIHLTDKGQLRLQWREVLGWGPN